MTTANQIKPTMTYRKLGLCGTRVSTYGLGGWTTFGGSLKDPQLTRQIITFAYESGVNFFDIADIYALGESERAMGLVLKDFPRHQLVVSSKCYRPMSDDINDRGLSRKHIMESIDKSLKRIGTDYLDLYFCHRFDPDTPIEETIRAMDDLVHQGKILYWGTSEWTADQLEEAHEICKNKGYYKPQVEQPQYNLLVRDPFESEVAPTAFELGMGLVTWSPLASGLLTGKYEKGFESGRYSRHEWLRKDMATEGNLHKVNEFVRFCKAENLNPTQLALAWAAAHEHVSSVILGATSLEQLSTNLGALSCQVSADVMGELEKIFG